MHTVSHLILMSRGRFLHSVCNVLHRLFFACFSKLGMMNNMNDFLPSRKVVALVLVPVVTIFLLWMINAYYQIPEVITSEKSELAATLEVGNAQFQERDTDGDGLKDWEEFLYQTDENLPDTDGDGASDGAEVNRGFDPLVAGNGTADEVAGQNDSGFTFYKQDDSLTRTDVLARDIFVAYADLKQSDAIDVVAIRDSAIDRAINENTSFETALQFTLEDLTTVAPSSFSRGAYKRAYAEATTILNTIQFSELELFTRYLEGDQVALVELAKNRDVYKDFIVEIRSISVPSDVSLIHLELINNVQVLVETIDNMLGVEQDPLAALVFAQKFLEDEEILYRNGEALGLYFQANGL